MKSTEQESMSICGDLTYFVMVYGTTLCNFLNLEYEPHRLYTLNY